MNISRNFFQKKKKRKKKAAASIQENTVYLFWWQYFDITSDFLFNKLFSLSSNISNFSFKQREHLFDWGLYALNWFFTAYVTFGLQFPAFQFQHSTDSFVVLVSIDVESSFMVCVSFFECIFTNSFIIYWLVSLFMRLCRYI